MILPKHRKSLLCVKNYIHNILEPASFGIPVIIGPNYQKFNEAKELIYLQGAYSFFTYNEFYTICDKLLSNNKKLEFSSNVCKNYIQDNIGATKKILQRVSAYL